ncbi:MAG: flagellar hook-length control protein FliK [Anaerohalosphaeraceae bacterium]
MTQTAGIANILTAPIEPSARTTSTEAPLSETASRKKTQQHSESASLTHESNPSPSFTAGEASDNSFLKVLNSKLGKKQTNSQISKKPNKQDDGQNESPAEALLAKLSEALPLPEKGLFKNPGRPILLNSIQTPEKNLSFLPSSPKSTLKPSLEATSVPNHLNTSVERPPLKPTPAFQPNNISKVKNESAATDVVSAHSSAGQKVSSDSKGSSASPEHPAVSVNKQNLIIQNPPKEPSAPAPNLPPKPLLTIPGHQPAVSGKLNESESEAAAEISLDKAKVKRSLNLSGAFDSTPNQESKDKNPLSTDLFNPVSVSSRLPQNTEAGLTTRSGTAVSESVKVSAEPDTPLSASQQVLRNLQTAVQNNVQTIQIALSPEGLGIVRIKFDKIGDEITGLLEVQKEQTRQEIEKSLPNILASLESQGISIRKIEVSQMPNSEHKHTHSDGPSDWNLRYEMQEERYRRPQSPDGASMKASATEISATPDTQTSYPIHPDSENLNLFI